MGNVLLSALAAVAQYYPDKLGQEVWKGKNERKAQSLYNGVLPFEVKKSESGILIADPDTYPGIQ